MSEAKFTKGEWYIDDLWIACDGSAVCAMSDSFSCYDNYQQNAHLIKVAPEMYTMLDFLVNQLKGVEETIAWDSVEELLAKARGEL